MGLLDGGGKALFGAVLSPIFAAAILRKTENVETEPGTLEEVPQDYDIRLQRDDFSSVYRTQANIPAADAKFIVLQDGAGAEPEQGDLIIHAGLSWEVVTIVGRDPVGASWVLQCTPHRGM
jgi:hypothetical protein